MEALKLWIYKKKTQKNNCISIVNDFLDMSPKAQETKPHRQVKLYQIKKLLHMKL
jgi:hypothetical protein